MVSLLMSESHCANQLSNSFKKSIDNAEILHRLIKNQALQFSWNQILVIPISGSETLQIFLCCIANLEIDKTDPKKIRQSNSPRPPKTYQASQRRIKNTGLTTKDPDIGTSYI